MGRASCLKLYKPTRRLGKDGVFGQLAASHRHLIAGMESWTNPAVLSDLIGQILAAREDETETSKEFGFSSKQADAADAMPPSFGQ